MKKVIKAWFVTLFVLLLLALAYALGLFALFTYSAVFYIAAALVVVMLAVAAIILGNPFAGNRGNDENGE